MIVPKMNSDELLIEIFNDLEIVNRKGTYLTLDLRREAIKSKAKYVQRVFDYKSRRFNEWFIIVDYYVKQPCFTVVVYYVDDFGLNGIMVECSNQALVHYTPHFLDRYNERFLGSNNISKLELLKRFISHNSIEVIKVLSGTDNNEQRIFARFKEGIGLGYKEVYHGKEFHHFKTFISVDMIHEGQLDVFNMTTKKYDEYWKEMEKSIRRCA